MPDHQDDVPMKQPPELREAQRQMRPGVVTRDGLLGNDSRPLAEILDTDDSSVRSMDLTHAEIAERMEHFTSKGRRGLGTTVQMDDHFEVRVQEWRGVLPCPWPHKGTYRKSITHLTNTRTGEEMTWTALSIHMVREHGFYGGRGSTYRVNPEAARRILEL
jgi:hypothetical protein